MARRSVSDSALRAHPDLLGRALASPFRRVLAFLLDGALLVIPSTVVAVASATLSLALTDPAALEAMRTLVSGRAQGPAETSRTLGDLAPLLVRLEAPGLPPSVAVAVAESDLERAGERLSSSDFEISLSFGRDKPPPRPGQVRIDVERLVPAPLRGAALFGVAAFYFTFFTARGRTATPGKRLLRLQVLRLDGRPLTIWESFERFGGYLASLGTLGLGVLDLWRDDNRRLSHDRSSNTVVVYRTPRWREPANGT